MHILRRFSLIACLYLQVGAAAAQITSPSFDVASVKPAGSIGLVGGPALSDRHLFELTHFRGGPGTDNPTRINYQGVTLKMLLVRALDIQDEQIDGPAWLDKEFYTVEATLPAKTDMDTFRLMLQGLLSDRFQIKFHLEAKISSVYALTVAKGGVKLKAAEKLPEYADDNERAEAMRARALELTSRSSASIRAGDLRNRRNSSGGWCSF
jgi:uncharacterized protein (TIGR03435 family)